MIFGLAKLFNQNPEIISQKYDVDDYLLYIGFESRQGNIDKYFVNKNNPGNPGNGIRKKVSEDEFFEMNRKK